MPDLSTDTVEHLAGVTHDETQYVGLTYRGDLPYFISPTKKYLEKIPPPRGQR